MALSTFLQYNSLHRDPNIAFCAIKTHHMNVLHGRSEEKMEDNEQAIVIEPCIIIHIRYEHGGGIMLISVSLAIIILFYILQLNCLLYLFLSIWIDPIYLFANYIIIIFSNHGLMIYKLVFHFIIT
ncbi:hypothetical protein ACJX0J_039281, partial [Zea mays]